MTTWLALADYSDGTRSVEAGMLLDDAVIDVARMQAGGLAAIVYNPVTMDASIRAFFAQRGGATRPTIPEGNLLALLIAAGAVISGAAAGGDLSGTYPNPTVNDDSHAHTPGVTIPAYPTALPPIGAAGGDLGGTYPSPTVTVARGLRETAGPTSLAIGAVADGQGLRRTGATVVGYDLPVQPSYPSTIAGTARTLDNSDNQARLRFTAASTVTVTVPSLAQGTIVVLRQEGAGQVQLSASGVTLSYPATFLPRAAEQNSVIVLEWITTTLVQVVGDLELA